MTAFVSPLFDWLLRASWQAAVLVLIVLLTQWALQKRLSARGRYALWFLVLLRLALPMSPRTAFSIYNYAHLTLPSPPSQPVVDHPPALIEASAVSPTARQTRASPAESPPDQITLLPDYSPDSQLTGATHRETRRQPLWRRLHLRRTGVVLWLAGIGFLVLQVIVQNLRFSRRVRSASIINEPEVVGLFDVCKRDLKISARIHLIESSSVSSPAIYGFFRPALLLPDGMSAQFSPLELRYIFLHELAHVKRRDMPMHWLTTALRILHWFNPILWFGLKRMAGDREAACDELALLHAGENGKKRYGETVVKLLERCTKPIRMPGMIGILEDKNQMLRRVRMILHFRSHRRLSVPACFLVAALALVSLTDAQSPKAEAEARSVPSASEVTVLDSEREMVFCVIDAGTGKALPGVQVRSWAGTNVTDAAGACHLTMPEPRSPHDFFFRITTSKDGYVSKHVSWSKWQRDDIADIPTRYTARMDRAVETGGTVEDESGHGIPHAKIIFSGPSPAGISEREQTTVMSHFHVEWTDDKGRWRCSHVSKEVLQNITYEVLHPDYIPKTFGTANSTRVRVAHVSASELLEQNAVLVLKHGLKVTGIVVDEAGQPVAGARKQKDWPAQSGASTKPIPNFGLQPAADLVGRVLRSDGEPVWSAEVVVGTENKGAILGRRDFLFEEQSITTHTDKAGRFRFQPVRGAHTIYVACDAGYAELDLEQAKPPFTIRLRPWGRLEGILIVEGRPANHGRVELLEGFWNPHQKGLTLYPENFVQETDDKGRFTIEDVPPVEVRVCREVNPVYKDGRVV